MLELGAVFCGVGYTLACRNLSAAMSPWVYTAAMSFGGVLFYLPLTFLPLEFSPVTLDVSIPDWLPLFSIFIWALLSACLATAFIITAFPSFPQRKPPPIST